jgi:hypothetical protein
MDPLTLFLAHLIGLYCLVIAATMMLRRRETIRTVNAMVANPGLIMISGVIALAGGLAMILGHNIWTGGTLAVIITLIGWVVTLKGAMLLTLSSHSLQKLFLGMRYERWFIFYMGGTLLLGLYLFWASFRVT